MFLAYRGFENLPLRVEVKWQGETRFVMGRIAQWPGSELAVVVCSFADYARFLHSRGWTANDANNMNGLEK